ncbi:hypothetical protein [Roseospira goensis]|uniref:Uncharacterized protein n=1 Tax=Roseospira goensis TaxID=391922 RepID=A0A7W6RXS1_9PROT|nr:hypothetical protein [Roseospira goensis]MBB4284544.1 hypothetical protein [Roseospira goensis]
MAPETDESHRDVMARLAQFLTDEVKGRDYADLLATRAAAAQQGWAAPGASGNAYYVGFGPEAVVIEHHYVKDWPPLSVPVDRFIAAVRAWRETLTHD